MVANGFLNHKNMKQKCRRVLTVTNYCVLAAPIGSSLVLQTNTSSVTRGETDSLNPNNGQQGNAASNRKLNSPQNENESWRKLFEKKSVVQSDGKICTKFSPRDVWQRASSKIPKKQGNLFYKRLFPGVSTIIAKYEYLENAKSSTTCSNKSLQKLFTPRNVQSTDEVPSDRQDCFPGILTSEEIRVKKNKVGSEKPLAEAITPGKGVLADSILEQPKPKSILKKSSTSEVIRVDENKVKSKKPLDEDIIPVEEGVPADSILEQPKLKSILKKTSTSAVIRVDKNEVGSEKPLAEDITPVKRVPADSILEQPKLKSILKKRSSSSPPREKTKNSNFSQAVASNKSGLQNKQTNVLDIDNFEVATEKTSISGRETSICCPLDYAVSSPRAVRFRTPVTTDLATPTDEISQDEFSDFEN